MTRKFKQVAPLDINNVEFTQAPYDGPIAVEQRLRNLVEIAIDIQTRRKQLKKEEEIDCEGKEIRQQNIIERD